MLSCSSGRHQALGLQLLTKGERLPGYVAFLCTLARQEAVEGQLKDFETYLDSIIL